MELRQEILWLQKPAVGILPLPHSPQKIVEVPLSTRGSYYAVLFSSFQFKNLSLHARTLSTTCCAQQTSKMYFFNSLPKSAQGDALAMETHRANDTDVTLLEVHATIRKL